jgi:GNAT superfamily N-acetyltransferase
VPGLETLPFSAGLISKHRDRFERQQRDEVLYILATQGPDIIGHLLLKWDGPSHPHVRALISACSEVEDFVVAPDMRGRGVGSEMLAYAGSQCLKRGVTRLGIAVGNENPSARRLYERRGFVPVPGSEHRVSWLAQGESGREVREYEDCVYLVKNLA